nr:efflux RND transporter periplasmic adaptor subunit [Phycisphaerae bacterium]NIX28698.1 efflux RND transporter periplasmic adaptor subunit [Phycisphaerae bacterium]
FVDRGNGRFEPREIKLGTKVGRYYVVLEGLEQGETIVKSGNFLIDAEAHVQGVLQRMED